MAFEGFGGTHSKLSRDPLYHFFLGVLALSEPRQWTLYSILSGSHTRMALGFDPKMFREGGLPPYIALTQKL